MEKKQTKPTLTGEHIDIDSNYIWLKAETTSGAGFECDARCGSTTALAI